MSRQGGRPPAVLGSVPMMVGLRGPGESGSSRPTRTAPVNPRDSRAPRPEPGDLDAGPREERHHSGSYYGGGTERLQARRSAAEDPDAAVGVVRPVEAGGVDGDSERLALAARERAHDAAGLRHRADAAAPTKSVQ